MYSSPFVFIPFCGLIEPALFGSVEKTPFDRASPRCIVTARKP